jgi:tRNA U38,U39,U40 pseudouridine synthase TruA
MYKRYSCSPREYNYIFYTLIISPSFCRLAVDWVSCYMDSVTSVCNPREYNYIFQYMKHTFIPVERTLQCDVLSGNL